MLTDKFKKGNAVKKIGMIGGLSWVSTAEYYRRLNELTQEKLGGVSSARIILESVDHQKYVEAVIDRQDEAAACCQILKAVQNVERAGADFIVISCNDVHRFLPKIASKIHVPFLHIAEATADAIDRLGLKTIGLLGVQKTMEGDFYQNILEKRDVATLVPNAVDRKYIDYKILDELNRNLFMDQTRAGYLKVIENLAERGAEGVILGCTEIPLLLSAEQIPIPSFSTTELHCRAAVERATQSDR